MASTSQSRGSGSHLENQQIIANVNNLSHNSMVSLPLLNTWSSTISSPSLASSCKPQTVTFDLLDSLSLTNNTSNSSALLKQNSSIVQPPTTSLNSCSTVLGMEMHKSNNNNHEIKRKRGRPKLESKPAYVFNKLQNSYLLYLLLDINQYLF